MLRFGTLPFYRHLFSPEGEGAGGGTGAAGGADAGAAGGDKGKDGGAGGGFDENAANEGGGLLAGDKSGQGQGQGEGEGEKKGEGDAGKKGGEAAAPYIPKDLPEHLRGKSDKETIDALAKAYAGARTELSKKGAAGKAPDKAEGYFEGLALPEGFQLGPNAKTIGDDPAIKTLATVAHKHGLTKTQFDGVVTDFLTAAKEAGMISEGFSAEREMAVLGGREKALPIITGINAWGKSLQSQGILSAQEFSEFQIMAGTGLGLVVMNKLRAMTGEKAIPTDLPGADGDKSEEELYAMVRDPKYGNDQAFTDNVTKLFAKRFGSGASNGQAPVAAMVGAR